METIKKFAKVASEWRAVSISVWYDHTSAEQGWIVDYIDRADNSLTVRVFASEAEARQFAASLSGAVGLPVR